MLTLINTLQFARGMVRRNRASIEAKLLSTFFQYGVSPLDVAVLRVIEDAGEPQRISEICATIEEMYEHESPDGEVRYALRCMHTRKYVKASRRHSGGKQRYGTTYQLTSRSRVVLAEFDSI